MISQYIQPERWDISELKGRNGEEKNLHDSPSSEFTSIAPASGMSTPNGLRRPSPTSLRDAQHCLDFFGGQALGALSGGGGRLAGFVVEVVELDGWEKGTASVADSVESAQRIVRGRIVVGYRLVR